MSRLARNEPRGVTFCTNGVARATPSKKSATLVTRFACHPITWSPPPGAPGQKCRFMKMIDRAQSIAKNHLNPF